MPVKWNLRNTYSSNPPGCSRTPDNSRRIALLRPHCCETIYRTSRSTPPMTDYQVLHTSFAHSSRCPIEIELSQRGRDLPVCWETAGRGVVWLVLQVNLLVFSHRWTPEGTSFNYERQRVMYELVIEALNVVTEKSLIKNTVLNTAVLLQTHLKKKKKIIQAIYTDS